VGAVVEFGGKVYEVSESIGVTTNNVAEYRAFILGLEKALRLGAEEVEARVDSELLVKQLTGAYRVKAPGLVELHEKARGLLASFRKASVVHVPRAENKKADALAKKAAAQAKARTTSHQPL